MSLMTTSKRLGPFVAAFAFAAALAQGEARAQFPFGGLGGFGGGGDPFMFMNFNTIPSSTQFLYDRSNAQVAQATAARESATSRASMIRNSPNAYWNNLRDFSGGSTYDVSSRRSLASRAAEVPPLRSPAPAPPPRVIQPLASFFKGDGPIDWPKDAPDDGAIGSERREAEAAITAVRDQVKSGGKAGAQSVGLAKSKLIGYGQQALARSRAERAPAMAEVFHYFLLILNDSLGEAGG